MKEKFRRIRVSTMGIEAIGFISTLHGMLKYNALTTVLGLTMILTGLLVQSYFSKCPMCGKTLKSMLIKTKECPYCHEQLTDK